MDDEPLHVPKFVPIFPLPEIVLFPRAVLPLHIHEPRYQQMTSDALANERIIATALLKPGFEPHYYTLRAPIHPVIGIGQIVASEQLDDGKFNILLRGYDRARILEEVPHQPYRVARVQPLDDLAPSNANQIDQLRGDLQRTIEAEFVGETEMQEYWLELFESSLGLGDLVDLIASGLPIIAELRQDLLAEVNPVTRAAHIMAHIKTVAAVTRTRRIQSPNAEW
ncbi:MAG: LON peptidase substrate-binding domain-containing protein, partial [Planctomycetota bacterium]